MPGTHGSKINKATSLAVLCGQDVIIKRFFVIIHVITASINLIQQLGQSQHVICIAGFGTLHVMHHRRKIIGRMKVLTHAVTTYADGTVGGNGLPEETGGTMPGIITLYLGYSFKTNHLGNLSIRMHAS